MAEKAKSEPLREAERMLLEEARARYESAVSPAWARLQQSIAAVMRDHGAPQGSKIAEDAEGRVLAVEWPPTPAARPEPLPPPEPPANLP